MDFGTPVLTVECDEPEGTFVRSVRPVQLNMERLKFYYDQLKQFDVVFNDFIENDLESFINIFLSDDGHDGIVSNGLIWEVDSVGIIYITDIRPSSAVAHFSFWDRRLKGRENLIRAMLRWGFDQFGFHRIEARVGLYAAPWVSRAIERVGFKKEGRLREAVQYKGEWFDMNVYSILEHEV
jgi:RimJ/RimL family protein N-acetyltransferase